MTEANKAYLNRFRHHWVTLRDGGYVGHLEHETRRELLKIAREEWEPNYLCCITCSEDVAQLVRYVYTQEEKHESNQQQKAKEVPKRNKKAGRSTPANERP